MDGKPTAQTDGKRRIVIVSRRYVDGAASNNRLLSYAKGFGEAGCDVQLIFCITQPDRAKFAGSFPGVSFHYLWERQPRWIARRKVLSYVVSLFQLARCIGRRDTVFMYYREVSLFYAVRLMARRLFCETTEHPFYNGKVSTARRMEFKLSLAYGRRLQGLFVISESLRNYYLGRGVPPHKLHIINMFVDTDRFAGPFPPADEPYIAYCGTVSKYKDGVDCLIRAFAIFHRRFPDYRLRIIGAAESNGVLEELRRLAESQGIGEATLFTGRVPAERMPALLGSARILALARPDNLQARNGFPTKLGEYLACGRPVVVTRVGEIGNFLSDGVNGLLADPDDAAAFAEKLIWAAEHPDQAARIGAEGRKAAFKEFSYRTQTARALAAMKINTEPYGQDTHCR